MPVTRKVPNGWDITTGEGGHGKVHRDGRLAGTHETRGKTVEPGRGIRNNTSFHEGRAELVETRNSRNVWTIAPKAFREAHFATFRPELARRMIVGGTPAYTCGLCGRIDDCRGGLCRSYPRSPGHVLDPFGGAGTVGLVAERLGVDATLIELNPEYAELAERRIFGPLVGPMLPSLIQVEIAPPAAKLLEAAE